MNYFVYCRKSTDREDKQILSTEAQQRILAEYAERHGLSIVDAFVENQSAYKAGRPKFNEMLKRLEKGHAKGVLTYHLTRLARNSFDGGRLIYMMDEGTIEQIATPEKMYVDNPDDKFMMQIHFAMAKKSSDDTSQFVTRDIESKLLRGELPGRAPIGYLNISREGHIVKGQDDREKYLMLLELNRPLARVEIDPIDGPIVKKLFEIAAKGVYRLPALTKIAANMGLRSKKKCKRLGKSMIEMILKNPFYRGALPYMGTVYDTALIREKSGNPEARVQHVALISPELYDRVQVAIRTRASARYVKHRFAFGGCMIRCGECGAPVTAERQKGIVYYHCTKTREGCRQTAWTREDDLARQFEERLGALVIPGSFLNYSLERLRSTHKEEANLNKVIQHKLQGELNAAQQRLDALFQMRISPANAKGEMLGDEEYVERKLEMVRTIESLRDRLRTAQEERKTWVDDCEKFLRFTQKMAAKFAEATVEEKQSMILLACKNLTLKDRRITAAYREPFDLLASFPLAGDKGKTLIEPGLEQELAERPEIASKWLHLMAAIRTCPLRPWTSFSAEDEA